MKTTKIISLNTSGDVKDFCNSITKLKNIAPGSLTFIVAITAERNVKEQKIKNSNGYWAGSIIEAEFNSLEIKLKAKKS